jgi:DisA bacterial checkpoint controller nucleotide-binding
MYSRGMLHAYPAQLASYVRNAWGDDLGTLPTLAELEALLSIAYQSSLLFDETRPVTFRLLFGSPDRVPEGGHPPTGLHRLRFAEPRPCTSDELRRLSPAVKFHRALVGVESRGGRLQLWGILQSGPRWLQSAPGGPGGGPDVPADALVIRVHGPGRLAIAKGEVTLAELRRGVVTGPGLDVFDSKWLPAAFLGIRQEILAAHERAATGATPPWRTLDASVVKRVSQQMVKRVITTMRDAHHGGTILFLPPEDAVKTPYLTMKYSFFDEEPRRRYRTLILSVLRGLAGAEGSGSLAALDEAVFELGHLIAALADVDGAVVLSKRFELIGFGAEIAGPLPEVHDVARAIDLEGVENARESIDGVGTRHRSAYRLCTAIPEAVAVVVSQDGAVRFVASLPERGLTYWEHTSAGSVDV